MMLWDTNECPWETDVGSCAWDFVNDDDRNGHYICTITPSLYGDQLLKITANGDDVMTLRGTVTNTVVVHGPFPVFMDVGMISPTHTTMSGPGLRAQGNVAGSMKHVYIQLRDRYGHPRTANENREVYPKIHLGHMELFSIDDMSGVLTVKANIWEAGYWSLRVLLGVGCLRDDGECVDISGSPSELMYWKPAPINANGTSCDLPEIWASGDRTPFLCSPKDQFGNEVVDNSLLYSVTFRHTVEETVSEMSYSRFDHSTQKYLFDTSLTIIGVYTAAVTFYAVGGLVARYFSDIQFSTMMNPRVDPDHTEEMSRYFTMVDPYINFVWPGVPDSSPLANADRFSIHWYAYVVPRLTTLHTIRLRGDGPMAMDWQGKRVVDHIANTTHAGPTDFFMDIELTNHEHYYIEIWYVHYTGTANITLSWTSPEFEEEVIPSSQLQYPLNVHHLNPPQIEVVALVASPKSELVGEVMNKMELVAGENNKITLITRDRFGNKCGEPLRPGVTAFVYLSNMNAVRTQFAHVWQGEYVGYVIPEVATATYIIAEIDKEMLEGYPKIVTVLPGRTQASMSVFKGGTNLTDVTVGTISCFSISLYDEFGNKRGTGISLLSDNVLEEVRCSIPEITCTHIGLGTWSCCVDIKVVPNGARLQPSCFVNRENALARFHPNYLIINVHPRPVSAEVTNTIGGETHAFGFRDEWPTTFFRNRENKLVFGENVVRMRYLDKLGNYVEDDAVAFFCAVFRAHAMGAPFNYPYQLFSERIGSIFSVTLDFHKSGPHAVNCYIARRGGLVGRYYPTRGWSRTMGEPTPKIEKTIDFDWHSDPVTPLSSMNYLSVRWMGFVKVPATGYYMFHLTSDDVAQVLLQGRMIVRSRQDMQSSAPILLDVQLIYDIQLDFTEVRDVAMVRLEWSNDVGLAREVIQSQYLYHSLVLLDGFPKLVNVTDYPGVAESFYRVSPFISGEITLKWSPPLDLGGKGVVSYRLRRDDGMGGECCAIKLGEVINNELNEKIRWDVTTFKVTSLSPDRKYRFLLEVSNDDRESKRTQIDGGGLGPSLIINTLSGGGLPPPSPPRVKYMNTNGTVIIAVGPIVANVIGIKLFRNIGWDVQTLEASARMDIVVDSLVAVDTLHLETMKLGHHKYAFRALWVSGYGESASSDTLYFECCEVPSGAPPQPQRDLEAIQLEDTISVLFGAPTIPSVIDIDYYVVECARLNDPQPQMKSVHDTAFRATFRGLRYGSDYFVRIRTVSATGLGPWSTPARLVATGHSSPPQNVRIVEQSRTRIAIDWDEPARTGMQLAGYVVYVDSVVMQNTTTAPRVRAFAFAPPIPGVRHVIVVEAWNAAGAVLTSRATLECVSAAPPGAPATLSLDREFWYSSGYIRLHWTLPAEDGGLAVTRYALERRKVDVTQQAYLTKSARLSDEFRVLHSGPHLETDHLVRTGANKDQVPIYFGSITALEIGPTSPDIPSTFVCSDDTFGDPFMVNVQRPVDVKRCYTVSTGCEDDANWNDMDGVIFDCDWYAAKPEQRCSLSQSSVSFVCCACGGGKTTTPRVISIGNENEIVTWPTGGTIYYGRLGNGSVSVEPGSMVDDNSGVVSCDTTLVPNSKDIVQGGPNLACFVLEYANASWVPMIPTTTPDVQFMFEDRRMVPNARYTYRAYAVNGISSGERNYTNELAIMAGGFAPQPPMYFFDSTEIMLAARWDPVVALLPVIGYRVYVDRALVHDTLSPDVLAYSWNCTSGKDYDFQVQSYTAAGESASSTILELVCARRPYKITDVTAEPACVRHPAITEKSSITIRYSPPTMQPNGLPGHGGKPIRGFRVQRAYGDTEFVNIGPTPPLDVHVHHFKDYKVTYGETYKYRVFALNGVDDANSDDASHFVSVFCASPPTWGPRVLERDSQQPTAHAINVSWPLVDQLGDDPNAGPITGYLLYANSGLDDVLVVTYNGTGKPHKHWFLHEHLVPGRPYRYQLSLLTDAGECPRSNVTIFKAAGIPASPKLERHPRGVLIGPPSDLAGSRLVEYEVELNGDTQSVRSEGSTVFFNTVNDGEIRVRARTEKAISDARTLQVPTDKDEEDIDNRQLILPFAQAPSRIDATIVRPGCENVLPDLCDVANDAPVVAVHLRWYQNRTQTFVVEKDVRSGPWRASGVFAPIAYTDSTFFVDTDVKRGDLFRYRLVVIVNSKSFVGPSTTVHAATAPSAPAAPTRWDRWNATAIRIGIPRLVMDFGGGLVSYMLEIMDNSTEWRFLTYGRVTSIKDLDPRTPYYFRARARNSIGYSPWSHVALLNTHHVTEAPAAPVLVWAYFDILGWQPRCPELTRDPHAVACVKIAFNTTLPDDDGCGGQSFVIHRDGKIVSNETFVSGADRTYIDWITDDEDIEPFAMWTKDGSSVVTKFHYQVQVTSCVGLSTVSQPLIIPLAPTAKPVCGRWAKKCSQCSTYECMEPGLRAQAIANTTLFFEWIGYGDTPSPSPVFFSAIPFQKQLIGSADINSLLGYKLYIDDGLRGPFVAAYDGTNKRLVHSATVENLYPGRRYRAYVTGVSWVGEGESSDVLDFPMALPPEPPTDITITYASTKGVTFTWTSSVSPVPVQFYRIERVEGPEFEWYPMFHSVDLDSGAEVFELLSLLQDTWYEFRMRAKSEAGFSLASPHIRHLVGDKPVGRATRLKRVNNTETMVTLSWRNVDVGDIGVPFLSDQPQYWGYRVYLYRREYVESELVCDTFGFGFKLTSCTIPNLTCGDIYKLTVSVITIIGEGEESDPFEVTVSVPPSFPLSLTAELTSDAVVLRWMQPQFTGCTPIYQYRILRDPGNFNEPGKGLVVVGFTDVNSFLTPAPTTYVDKGDCFPRSLECICPPHCLVPGRFYRYRVEARGQFRSDFDEYGPSKDIEVVLAVPPERLYGPPQLVQSSWGEFELRWPSAENSNAPILNYKLEVSVDGLYRFVSDGLTRQRRMTAITGGGVHRFRVLALSGAGISDPSPEACLIAASPPQAPRLPVVASSLSTNTFTWQPRLVGNANPSGLTLEFGVSSPGSVAITITVPGDAAQLVGGSACRQVKNVLPEQIYRVALGGQYDKSGCLAEPGSDLEARFVLTGVENSDQPVEVTIPFSVPAGVTNGFARGIVAITPLTLNRITVTFEALRRGVGWGMIRQDDVENKKITATEIKNMIGAEGGFGCRIAERDVLNEVTVWNFYDCGLTRWAHYRVFVYISGLVGDNAGTSDHIRMRAIDPTNRFVSHPWVLTGPTGDGLTVEFTPQKVGFVWLVISLSEVINPSSIKTYPDPMCAVSNIAVTTARQVVTLSNCFLTSGLKYVLSIYLDVADDDDKKGSLNRPIALYAPLSNSFIEYFSLVANPVTPSLPLIHGMGFTFRFQPRGTGFFWSLVSDPARRSEVTVITVKAMGDIALGDPECHVKKVPLDGSIIVHTLSSCHLSPGQFYDFFIYVEDDNDVNDGFLAAPRTILIPRSNFFQVYPAVTSVNVDRVELMITPMHDGRCWAMVASVGVVPTIASIAAGSGALGQQTCFADGVVVTAQTSALLSLTQCALEYSTTYSVHVYIDDGRYHLDGSLAAGVPFTIGPSNKVTSHSITLDTINKVVHVSFTTALAGVFWLSVVRADDVSYVTPDNIKTWNYNWGTQGDCTIDGQSLGANFATAVTATLSACRFIGGHDYYLVAYVETGAASWNDGQLYVISDVLSAPPSNFFEYEPRVAQSPTTNDLKVHYKAKHSGLVWIFVTLQSDAHLVTYFNAKGLPNFVGRNNCVKSGSDVGNLGAEEIDLGQCELTAGVLYTLFLYTEDFNRLTDGYLTPPIDIVVSFPTAASQQIHFYRTPHLTTLPGTVNMVEVTFTVSEDAVVWAMIVAKENVRLLSDVEVNGGHHMNSVGVSISEMKTAELAEGKVECRMSAVHLLRNVPLVGVLTKCQLTAGKLYYFIAYAERDLDVAVDGRMGALVTVAPPRSNKLYDEFVLESPSGNGVLLKFRTTAGGIAIAVIRATSSDPINPRVLKEGIFNEISEFLCSNEIVVLGDEDTSLELTRCKLTALGSYEVFLYVEGDDNLNDGSLHGPVPVAVPNSNVYNLIPILYSYVTIDGFTIICAPAVAGVAWGALYTEAQPAMNPVYIKENKFNFAKCTMTTSVNGEVSFLTFTSCGLMYLETYVVYIYVEDASGYNDGRFALLNVTVPSSNVLLLQPTLGPVTAAGTSLTFEARENGRAWCIVSHVENQGIINSDTVKDPANANSPTCASAFDISAGTSTTCALTNCGLRVDALYLGFVYVENYDSAGQGKGQLSVPTTITVPLTNKFVRSPVRVPTTSGDILVEFEVLIPGTGWGMIVQTLDLTWEDLSVTDFKNGADTWGTRASPILCPLMMMGISGTQTWTFTNCDLEYGREYSVCVYIEDAYNNDGIAACVTELVREFANMLTMVPTATTSGTALTVDIHIASAGIVRIAAAHTASTIIDEKTPCVYETAVAPGTTTLQFDCGVQSDPLRIFAVWVDNRWTPPQWIGEPPDIRVLPITTALPSITTNVFTEYPRISGSVSPSGITVSFAPEKDGMAWALISRTLSCASGEDVMRGVNAVGREGGCFLKGVNVTSMVTQTLQLTNCALEIGETYYSLFYLVGHEGNGQDDGGGVMAPAIEVFVPPNSNSFVIPPALSATYNRTHVAFDFTPAQSGRIWAEVVPTRKAPWVSVEALKEHRFSEPNCRLSEEPITLQKQEFSLGCVLEPLAVYSLFVYIDDGAGQTPGELSAPVVFTVPPHGVTSNDFAAWPILAEPATFGEIASEVVVTFDPWFLGKLWMYITCPPWNFDLTPDNVKLFLEHVPQQQGSDEDPVAYLNCRKDGIAIPAGKQTHTLKNCRLDFGQRHYVLIYIEDDLGLGDGILAAPLRVTDQQNTFVQYPRITGRPTVTDVQGVFQAKKEGFMWVLLVTSDEVKDISIDRIKFPPSSYTRSCNKLEKSFPAEPLTTVQLTNCTQLPNQNYWVFIYIAGQEDDPDNRGAMAPFVLHGSRRENSNLFNTVPYLYELKPTEVTVRFTAGAGWAWVMVVPFGAAVSEIGTEVDICRLGPNTITHERQTWVVSSCPFRSGSKYEAYVYVAQQDLTGGVLASFEFSQFFDLSYVEIFFDLPVAHQGGDPAIEYRILLDREDFARVPLYKPTQLSSRVIPCVLGLSYAIELQTKNRVGWSPVSEPITALCARIPTAPVLTIVGVPATEDPTQVLTLSWTEPTLGGLSLYAYRLYRDKKIVYEGPERLFVDHDVIRGPRYLYWVTAATRFAEGPSSEPIIATLKTVPMAPTTPELEVVSPWEIRIRWEAASSGGSAISSYEVLRAGLRPGDPPQIVYPLSNYLVSMPLVIPAMLPTQLQIMFYPGKAGRARAFVMDGEMEICVREWEDVTAVATTWDMVCPLKGLWRFTAYIQVGIGINGGLFPGELSPPVSFGTAPEPVGTTFLDARADLVTTSGTVLHVKLDRSGDVEIKLTPWYDYSIEINCGPTNAHADMSAVVTFTGCDFPIGIFHKFHLSSGGTNVEVDIAVPLRSNWFVTPPFLTGTPVFEMKMITVTLNLGSSGRIWAILVKEQLLHDITRDDIRNQNEDKAVTYDPTCRFDGVSVVQGIQEVVLSECGVSSNSDVFLLLYVEDDNDRSDGTVSERLIVTFPDNSRRNRFEIMPKLTFVSAHAVRFSMKATGYSAINTGGKVYSIILDPADEEEITQRNILTMKTENDMSHAVGSDNCKMNGASIDIAPVELELFDCNLTPGKEYVMPVMVSDDGVTLVGYSTLTIPDTHLRFTIPWLSNGFTESIKLILTDPLTITFTPELPGRLCVGLRPLGSKLPVTMAEAQTMLAYTNPCFHKCVVDVPDSQVTVTFGCAAPLGSSQLTVYLNGLGTQPGKAVPFPIYVPVDIPEIMTEFDEWPSWIPDEPGTLSGVLRLVPAQPGVLSAWVSTQPRNVITGVGEFAVSECRVVQEKWEAAPIEIGWSCPTPQGMSPLYIIIVFNGVFIEVTTIHVPWPTPGVIGHLHITDRLLAPQAEVSYQVRAVNELGLGLESLAAVRTVTTPPAQPFPPQVINGTAYGFVLMWSAPASNMPILEYRLRQRDVGLIYSGTLRSITARVRAAYSVAAVNIRGISSWSAWVKT
eukprot:GEMP01000004.1.p1 GENE.GEMP01000004.1~~GEMP01000004.1.p1  ORF type:complete len:6923 (+),score=1032.53 GEMP01000004.1:2456-20770(+)